MKTNKMSGLAALLGAVITCVSLMSCGDGVFEAKSRSKYESEPYWGVARLYVKDRKIDRLEFSIRDTTRNRDFDAAYEEVFAGNDEYVNQCRNDSRGLAAYVAKFNETKRLEDVDAISGATWSFNIFVDTVKLALEKAQIR
jgi:major membrane immunogen (membrane-anchored lipoprotein)